MSPGPLVSVVTPFYNTAEFLDECIASVVAQTHRDFEYLLLDNASDDGSSEIAARWAAQDPRIRVERNPRLLEQVPNYNRALTLISGESRWVKVVQADDLIFPRCLEEMVALGESAPAVGLISSYYLMGRRLQGSGLAYRDRVVPGREICRLHHRGRMFLFGSPSMVMYRGDIVRAREPFYTVGRLHEDTEAAYEILGEHDFGFVHQVLSFMRQRDDSIMAGMQSYGFEMLDHLITLRRYGPRDLDAEEYRRRFRDEEDEYYRFLGSRRFTEKDPGFWEHHRRGLATIDETLDEKRVLREALVGSAKSITKQAARWVIARAGGRRRGSSR